MNAITVLSRVPTATAAGVVKQIFETSPILAMADYTQKGSIAFSEKRRYKLMQATTRDYNATRAESTQQPYENVPFNMFDFGIRAPIDPVLALEPAIDGSNHKADVRQEIAEAISLDSKGVIINGTGSHMGIKQFVDDWTDTANPVKILFGTGGAQIGANGKLEDLTRMLFELKVRVRPTMFVTTEKILSIMASVLLNQAATNAFAQYIQWQTVNVMGQTQNFITFDGIPIIDAGEDSQGAKVLDFNEDPGDGASDTASIYAVRWGALDTTINHRFPGLVMYSEEKSGGLEYIDTHAPMQLTVRNKRAAGRIYGILDES